MSRGLLFILAGPSGAGKTTLFNSLQLYASEKAYPLRPLVTYTTRKKRPGEENEKDYFFVSKEEFLFLKQKDFFFEITYLNDNFYGTPASLFEDLNKGVSYIAILDRSGIKKFQQAYHNVLSVWIRPSDISDLRARLLFRDSVDDMYLAERLRVACEDVLIENENSICDFIIYNDDLLSAQKKLLSIFESFMSCCLYGKDIKDVVIMSKTVKM